LEAEYRPFDKALLASDDFCGRITPDKFLGGGFWLGFHMGHGAPMWPYANGVEL
jgi:hypothetical protein